MLTYGLDGELFVRELTAFENLMESGYWNKKENAAPRIESSKKTTIRGRKNRFRGSFFMIG